MKKNFKKKKNIALFIRGWFGSIIFAILLATSFKSAIADWNLVPTGSMKPTIVEGDRIFVNKLAYDLKVPYTTWRLSVWDNPNRGDIVVFYSPVDGTRLVKRVVGIPGDLIALHDNQLFINNKAVKYENSNRTATDITASEQNLHQLVLTENLAGKKHPVLISPYRLSPRSFGPITVPKGCYFVLGDNRDNSADSRYFGFVERRQIVGQATGIVVSLDQNNRYRPRFKRFFTKLP